MSLLEKRAKVLLEGLSRTIASLADEVSPKSVHQLRSTTRRLESLFAFARPDLGRKQRRAIEQMVALRKRAGKVRNLDVQMDLLGTIANGSTIGDRRELMESLKGRRLRQAKRLRSDISSLQRSRLLAHLERIVQKTGVMSGRPLSSPYQEARRQLSSVCADVTSHQPIPPRLLHKVRIRMKGVGYLAEMGPASAEQQRMLRSLTGAQEALGAWHHWEGLAKTAEKLFGERLNCPLLTEVRALFAARYAAATAAVARLSSTAAAAPPRKQPKGADTQAVLARPA